LNSAIHPTLNIVARAMSVMNIGVVMALAGKILYHGAEIQEIQEAGTTGITEVLIEMADVITGAVTIITVIKISKSDSNN